MLPTKFRFIWPNGFRGEEFKLEAQVSLYRSPDINKSSPLSQMNRKLVGIIYGRSSIKIAHFVPIH
jgi:hypothetical protein